MQNTTFFTTNCEQEVKVISDIEGISLVTKEGNHEFRTYLNNEDSNKLLKALEKAIEFQKEVK